MTAPRREPFPDCGRLADVIYAAEADRAGGEPGPERPESPYRDLGLSSLWELHADGREFIDGVEIRPPWWRRWLRRRAQ